MRKASWNKTKTNHRIKTLFLLTPYSANVTQCGSCFSITYCQIILVSIYNQTCAMDNDGAQKPQTVVINDDYNKERPKTSGSTGTK